MSATATTHTFPSTLPAILDAGQVPNSTAELISSAPAIGREAWDILCPVSLEFTYEYEEEGKTLRGIKPILGLSRMTSLFGPVGYGWGFEMINEEFRGGHIFGTGVLWYRPHFLKPEIPFHMVCFVKARGGAKQTDHHSTKRCETSCLQRCFMKLGLAAPIYAGLYNPEMEEGNVGEDVLQEGLSADEMMQAAARASVEHKGDQGQPTQAVEPVKPEAQASPEPVPAAQPDSTEAAPPAADVDQADAIDKFIFQLKEQNPLLEGAQYEVEGNSVWFVVAPGHPDEARFVKMGFAKDENGWLGYSVKLPKVKQERKAKKK